MNKGFTLVELLIVIIIVAVVSSIAVPKIYEGQTRAKEAKLIGDLNNVRKAVEQFELDTGYVPDSTAALTGTTMPASAWLVDPDRMAYTNVVNPPGTGYRGPYLETTPICPFFGAQYQIKLVRTVGGPYRVQVVTRSTRLSLSGRAYNTY